MSSSACSKLTYLGSAGDWPSCGNKFAFLDFNFSLVLSLEGEIAAARWGLSRRISRTQVHMLSAQQSAPVAGVCC